jgi:biopolymer transport protein ExbD
VEKQPITLPQLFTTLTNRFQHNERLPVLIGGDAETRHGDMVAVLDFVRRAGVQKVSFTVNAEQTPGHATR